MLQSPSEFVADRSETTSGADENLYEVLSSERRRVVLSVLADRRAPMGLDPLAAAVAARETDADTVDGGTVDRVALTLHHNHLPRMADAGVIKYDTTTNRVESFERRAVE